jgi:HEAT repeats
MLQRRQATGRIPPDKLGVGGGNRGMTAADRNSNLGRLLGRVLAITWALALLVIGWQWIRPSPTADEFRGIPDRSAVVGNAIASSNAVELAPTLLPLPGGRLPIQPADPLPAVQVLARPGGLDHSTESTPERLPEQVAGRSLVDNSAPSALTGAPAANRPMRLPSEVDALASNRSVHANSGLDVPVESRGDKRERPAVWARLELRDVMHLLSASDPTLAAAAQEELQRRGIVGPLVDLARFAGDADPAVRRAFVESLPTLSGVDARPWLLELSYDDDPRVRAAAVTLMATSGDLELLKRVKQVALEDPDDQTRGQAAKALPDKPVERR